MRLYYTNYYCRYFTFVFPCHVCTYIGWYVLYSIIPGSYALGSGTVSPFKFMCRRTVSDANFMLPQY